MPNANPTCAGLVPARGALIPACDGNSAAHAGADASRAGMTASCAGLAPARAWLSATRAGMMAAHGGMTTPRVALRAACAGTVPAGQNKSKLGVLALKTSTNSGFRPQETRVSPLPPEGPAGEGDSECEDGGDD